MWSCNHGLLHSNLICLLSLLTCLGIHISLSLHILFEMLLPLVPIANSSFLENEPEQSSLPGSLGHTPKLLLHFVHRIVPLEKRLYCVTFVYCCDCPHATLQIPHQLFLSPVLSTSLPLGLLQGRSEEGEQTSRASLKPSGQSKINLKS